jgi:hypothetical protein
VRLRNAIRSERVLDDKSVENLCIILSHMCNFKVFFITLCTQAFVNSLGHQICSRFGLSSTTAGKFQRIHYWTYLAQSHMLVALLTSVPFSATVVLDCGFSIRREDPMGLKNFISAVHTKIDTVEESYKNESVYFSLGQCHYLSVSVRRCDSCWRR